MSIVNRFVEWSHTCLNDSEEAQDYLRGRGSSSDQWARHQIGYVGGDFVPDPLTDPFHNENCEDRDKKNLWCDTCRFRNWSSVWEGDEGVKVQHVGRRITGSVVYPLTSYSGSIVGFQTRSIKEKAYDTFAVRRRPEGYFFGVGPNMHSIWFSGDILIVEGPSDQLVMERLVLPGSVALATNSINQSQLRFLKRFVRRVYLCLDLDSAGRDGTNSFLTHMNEFDAIIDLKYPRLKPKDKDPGDFWKSAGDEKFAKHFKREMETSK